MQMSLLAVAFLVLVATGVATRRRRRFREAGDAFRCRLRACSFTCTPWRRLARRWSRPMWAKWVGDVLVVRRGPVFDREITLHARVTSAGVYALPWKQARWCGPRPIAVGLTVSGGSCVEMAAADMDRMALVGPYLAAAISELPGAPVPRRRI